MSGVTDDPDETGAPPDDGLGIARVKQVRNQTLVRERRTQILDAALALFIEKGYANTTIRDICARCGVNQASLYDYVANKEDILRRLLERIYPHDRKRIGERALAGDFASPEAFLRTLFGYSWTTNRDAILLSYRVVRDLNQADRRAMLDRDLALVRDVEAYLGQQLGLPPDDGRLRIAANLIMFLNAFVPFRQWAMPQADIDAVKDTVVQAVAALLDGMARQPAPAGTEAAPPAEPPGD